MGEFHSGAPPLRGQGYLPGHECPPGRKRVHAQPATECGYRKRPTVRVPNYRAQCIGGSPPAKAYKDPKQGHAP